MTRKAKPTDPMENTACYSQKSVRRGTSMIGVSLSSILPLMSIILLRKIQTLFTRLWIIGGYAGLFSSCLGRVASTRKVEIFSAAAASVIPRTARLLLVRTGMLPCRLFLSAVTGPHERTLMSAWSQSCTDNIHTPASCASGLGGYVNTVCHCTPVPQA